MFRFISWDEFFIGFLIIMVVYYILLAAFCYRREITNFIKGGTTHKVENPIKNNDIEDLEQAVSEVNGIAP